MLSAATSRSGCSCDEAALPEFGERLLEAAAGLGDSIWSIASMVRRMTIARHIGPSMTTSPRGTWAKARISFASHAVRDDRRFDTAFHDKGSIRLRVDRHKQDIKDSKHPPRSAAPHGEQGL